ncbi:MAG: hypothetical protein K0Q93_2138 [Nocardioidaceae bacterium]|jgi:hypothetical protein|nr:hypothetical protein [Nocardioidaceae bacterium]
MATLTLKDVGEFPFDRTRLTNVEALLLEKVSGRRLADIVEDFNERKGPLGLTAFLWLAMRRAGHHVAYTEFEFNIADVVYDLSDEDVDARPPAEVTPDPPAAAAASARKRAGSKPS